MKVMSVSNDIVPIGKFKTSLSKWFKSIQNTGHPLIITQNAYSGPIWPTILVQTGH